MMDKIRKEIINHYKSNVSNQWELIKSRLAEELAKELLMSLEEFSDPQGTELIDYRLEYISKVKSKNRMGA